MAARVTDRLTVEVGPTIQCACGCAQTILQFDEYGRERCYVNGHNMRALWRDLKKSRASLQQPPSRERPE